jgi:hypothetical protein
MKEIYGWVEKRSRVRRGADRNFRFVLFAAFTMTFLTGVALGYYYAASEAAGIVLGAK